jgi:hypothetical protein
VGALVSGAAAPVWVRWLAASKVFDEMWERRVLAEDEAAQRPELSASGGGVQFTLWFSQLRLKDLSLNISFFLCAGQHKHRDVKNEWTDGSMIWIDRRRVEFIYLHSLRMMLPVYSTFVQFVSWRHVAWEAILPTNIYRSAMEGKPRYVAAFTLLDN